MSSWVMMMLCFVTNVASFLNDHLVEKVMLPKSLKSQAGWPGVGSIHQDCRWLWGENRQLPLSPWHSLQPRNLFLIEGRKASAQPMLSSKSLSSAGGSAPGAGWQAAPCRSQTTLGRFLHSRPNVPSQDNYSLFSLSSGASSFYLPESLSPSFSPSELNDIPVSWGLRQSTGGLSRSQVEGQRLCFSQAPKLMLKPLVPEHTLNTQVSNNLRPFQVIYRFRLLSPSCPQLEEVSQCESSSVTSMGLSNSCLSLVMTKTSESPVLEWQHRGIQFRLQVRSGH